jgi:TonB family protein
MSDTFARAEDHSPASERRAHARQLIPSLAYVELDEGNGGIILNISEGGLSVQAVAGLMEESLPGVRFQLDTSDRWIETAARISWTNDTRKLAGLEFLSLSEDSRDRIRKWLDRDLQAVGSEATDARDADEMSAARTDALADAAPPLAALDRFSPMIPEATATRPDEGPEPPDAAVADLAEPDVETASSVLANLLTSVGDQAHRPLPESPPAYTPAPPAPIPFRQPLADAKATEETPEAGEDLLGSRWSAILVLVVLAIGSLAAGWAVGQGRLGRLLARLDGGASERAQVIRGALAHLGAPAVRLSEIEVENSNGERWSIPFNGPLNPSVDSARRPSALSGEPDARKTQPGFRTWILTPPSPQTHARTEDGADTREPPAVIPESAPGDNVLNSGAARSLAPPTVLAVPQAPAPTGVIRQGQLIHRVDPVYPEIAKNQRAQGTVRLNIAVGPDGVVRGVALLGGPRLLVDAAERAVRQWRYAPTLLDGKPVEFQREVDLTFRLSSSVR